MTTREDDGGWRAGVLGRALHPRDPRLVHGLGAVALVSVAMFWVMHRALSDDGYITLVYVRNLVQHLHWGMLPDQVSNTATSPGFVLAVSTVALVVRDPVWALGVVYVGQSVAMFLALYRLGTLTGLGPRFAWVATLLLVLNPLLVSSIGLETMFAVTLLLFLTWAAAADSPRWFGVVAGLLALVRLDLGVFVAVLFLTRPALLRKAHVAVGLGAVVALPWFVYSWTVLGSAIPDTLLIKQAARGAGEYASGLARWADQSPWPTVSSVVVPAIGVVAALAWPGWRHVPGLRRTGPIAALALGGAAYYVVYVLLVVPPFFWYYGAPIAALTVAAAAGLSAWSHRWPSRRAAPALFAATGVLLAPMAVGWAVSAAEAFPLQRTPMNSNWGTPAQYEHIARELPGVIGDQPVRSPGEIGTLLYFCDCRLVDRFTDRGRMADLIEEAERGSMLMRWNYVFLDIGSLRPDVAEVALGRRWGRDPSDRGWNLLSPRGEWSHLRPVRRGGPW